MLIGNVFISKAMQFTKAMILWKFFIDCKSNLITRNETVNTDQSLISHYTHTVVNLSYIVNLNSLKDLATTKNTANNSAPEKRKYAQYLQCH